jgi:hypothetical protein
MVVRESMAEGAKADEIRRGRSFREGRQFGQGDDMALSAFDDKSRPPREAELAATLGKVHAHWNELRRLIAVRFAPLTEDWGFSSASTGWGLRLKQEKRTVLYMTPCAGHFLASFALGEKAVKAAHEGSLPASVLEVIDSARKYAEGRGVRLVVKSARDVRNVEKLAAIKMAT